MVYNVKSIAVFVPLLHKPRIEKTRRYGTRTGKPIGRPPRTLPKNFEKYYKKWKQEKIKATEFAKLIEVSRATLYRYIKEYEMVSF